MFGTILRKKVSDDKLANVFINGLFKTIDEGFPVIAEFINDDQAFVTSPNIASNHSYEFSLIVVVGNLSFLESAFEPEQANRVEALVFEKLARIYEMEKGEFKQLLKDYKNLMWRLNHPSKNMIYAMSKAIFDKYTLYNYQDEYFKRMQAPNPLFLKRMDEVIENFIWDWDAFFRKYKLD
ncbi:hypothetical protein N9L43_00875 [bacterium]|nr:hypothetical protein [bacterium]MDB2656771.1 hypothetical protein [Crocinitomicaceae bacterium]MDC0257669.1 hypothetical protein [Crocinitomicaceae bacterium]